MLPVGGWTQSISQTCGSQIGSSTQVGVKLKKIFELPPPLQDGLNGVNKTNKPTNQQTNKHMTL